MFEWRMVRCRLQVSRRQTRRYDRRLKRRIMVVPPIKGRPQTVAAPHRMEGVVLLLRLLMEVARMVMVAVLLLLAMMLVRRVRSITP